MPTCLLYGKIFHACTNFPKKAILIEKFEQADFFCPCFLSTDEMFQTEEQCRFNFCCLRATVFHFSQESQKKPRQIEPTVAAIRNNSNCARQLKTRHTPWKLTFLK